MEIIKELMKTSFRDVFINSFIIRYRSLLFDRTTNYNDEMTRWLSCAEAVRVVLNSRNVYYNYFVNESNENAEEIAELLENGTVIAWYACLQDVLPVHTGMNVLFQSNLPLPHLLYPRISSARRP